MIPTTKPARVPTSDPAGRRAGVPEQVKGMLYGLLGVLCFSLTPPATRAAVAGGLDPLFVGAGRACGAGLLAGMLLVLTRQPRPRRAHLGRLASVIGGVTLGFPLLTAWALQRLPASHAAAVIGTLPLVMAVDGTVRGGERPSAWFWLAGVAGSAIVVAFAWGQGGGRLELPDLALFGAVLCVAVGYTDGARLARTLGGWQTISWALALALPVTGALTLASLWLLGDGRGWDRLAGGAVPASAWWGFGYVTVCSQWLGFFPWYRGLALGGVTRVSQLQLAMPFLTIGFSALLLGERLTPATLFTALAVFVTVVLGRFARVGRATGRMP